jgi:hypothetical protein
MSGGPSAKLASAELYNLKHTTIFTYIILRLFMTFSVTVSITSMELLITRFRGHLAFKPIIQNIFKCHF